MLRLKAAHSLNSSAGGVLYHYCPSLKDLESILANGIKASDPQPIPGSTEKVPYISFSRSKTNPPYTEIANEDTGSLRWKFGVVLSKDKLSNLGKFIPYHYGASQRFINFTVEYLDPDEFSTELPRHIELDVRLINRQGSSFVIVSYVAYDNEPDGDNTKVLGRSNPGSGFHYPSSRFDEIWDDVSSQPTVVDNVPDSTGCTFTLQLDLDEPIKSKVVMKILQEIKLDQKWAEKHIKSTQPAKKLVIHGQGYPITLPNSGETSYNKFKESLKELKQLVPNAQIEYLKDEGMWIVSARLPDYVSFRDLPKPIQIIVSQSSLFESEDRLLLPNSEPGTPIPQTKSAIIGIVVPMNRYHTNQVQELGKKYNLPIYVYQGKNSIWTGEAFGEKRAPKVPEAYKNPIA